jgi:hypothetical protein
VETNGAVIDAKIEAALMREAIAKLSPLEKSIGAKYLGPVERLIKAVERI